MKRELRWSHYEKERFRPLRLDRLLLSFEHYVPRVYLRHFVASNQGRNSIFRFDKTTRRTSLRNISRIAGETSFYELDGLPRGRIESYLSRIESDFGPAINKVLSSQDIIGLSEDDKRAIAYFAATQLVRTLEIRELARDLAESLKESFKGDTMTEALRTAIEEAQMDQAIQEVHLSLIEQIPYFAGNILEKKWVLALNETGVPFWTSDHPVNMVNEVVPEGLPKIGISVPGIQIILPLGPTASLFFADFKYYMYEPDVKTTTDVNNVIFYNDWQVMWATRYLFSSTSDFSLARRILEERPSARDIHKHRVSSRVYERNRRPVA